MVSSEQTGMCPGHRSEKQTTAARMSTGEKYKEADNIEGDYFIYLVMICSYRRDLYKG